MTRSIDAVDKIIRDVRGSSHQVPTTRSSHFVDDLGLRSIELIALIKRTELAFGVNLISRMDRLANVWTIGQLLDLVDELRATSVEA